MLDTYSNSRYVLDHIIDKQKKNGDVNSIGYQFFPPPMRHNCTKLPDDENMSHSKPNVPLDHAEFVVGLGFKKCESSSQHQSVRPRIQHS
ncbi:hypothetical protein Hanom_Chr03g00185271 [Helianthus anomalus]